MSDSSAYLNNLQSFLNNLKGSQIEKIQFEEDMQPTFDKNKLPFKFSYCLSVTFITNKGNFQLITSQTYSGSDRFWVKPIDSLLKSTSEKVINSVVKNVTTIQTLKKHPYKFSIHIEMGVLLFYAAEIYDRQDDNYSISLNDEMVFVFDNEIDALYFENSIN